MGEDGRLRFSTNKPREIARVQDPLLQIFRSLAAGRAPWPLFLWGAEGRGKSCAALALADYVPRSVYLTCFALVKSRHDSYKPQGAPLRMNLLDPEHAPLVVLDEMGLRAVSDTHYEVVHELLDLREGAGLIAISNHSLESLASIYDRRTADRLGAGCQFELKGDSRRTG